MLIKHAVIVQKAKAAGYEDVNDYGVDHDLAQCGTCKMWGRYGDDIKENEHADLFCDEHRPEETN